MAQPKKIHTEYYSMNTNFDYLNKEMMRFNHLNSFLPKGVQINDFGILLKLSATKQKFLRSSKLCYTPAGGLLEVHEFGTH